MHWLQKTVDMMDSSDGIIDLRYKGSEEQDNVLIFEKMKKEKRQLQETLNK